MAAPTPSDPDPEVPAPEAQSPDAPDARRRRTPFGLPPLLFLSTIIGSLAIAVLIATWVVPRDGDGASGDSTDQTITVEDLVNGEVQASVDGAVTKGQAAPDTVFQYLDGSAGSLAELAGRPIVVNFWASSCAPCLKEMPAFEQLHQELGDQVTVLGVDVSEGIDPGKAMVERTGVTYRQARDPQGDLLRAYGGIQLPHTVVIDAHGVVTEMRNKALDHDEIQALVAPLTSGG